MPSFIPPFDPTNVMRQPDQMLVLPDTPRSPDEPIVRSGVARYAGTKLFFLHVAPNNTSFEFVAPVTGVVRNIELDAPLESGINQLLEISPLPFTMASTLGALVPGLPTFYLGYARSTDIPADDELIEQDTTLLTDAESAYIGVIFQDRVTLAPWGWIGLLGNAMEATGDISGAEVWHQLLNLYGDTPRSLRILDHAGRPAARTFDIRIRRTDDTYEGTWQLTSDGDGDGDLEKAAASLPLLREDNTLQPSLFGAPGEQTELTWIEGALPDDEPLPVHALYDGNLSTLPGEAILLPANTVRDHLYTLELGRWFAPRAEDSSLASARYRTDSRVEPLIDGTVTFKRLVDDLLASASDGNGAHFAGWAFKDFPLDAGRKDAFDQEIDTRLTALVQRIIDNDGEALLLPTKFIEFKTDPDSEVESKAILAITILTHALIVLSGLGATSTSVAGYFVLFGGQTLTQSLFPNVFSASEAIRNKVEQSLDIFPELNSIRENIAIWSHYPIRLIDNPVAITPFEIPVLSFNVDDYLDQFGAWHQKIQLVKRSADDDGNEYAAYIGGIDINKNRLDTPGHQTLNPFHDVHARVTGPGAADVFQTWHERYEYDRNPNGTPIPNSIVPMITPPVPTDLLDQPAKHITQIGRTYFRPKLSGGSEAFPFAPSGESSINDTLIRAIQSAREYIYIEDQYFTPNDSEPAGESNISYIDALLGVAGQCKRLLIVVPGESDQPFGDVRRRDLFAQLRSAWGNRVMIGAPVRRPMLPNTGRLASEGRCILLEGLSDSATSIVIGPKARVPVSSPYWLWIDGELMLSVGPPDELADNAVKFNVLRCSITERRWGAAPTNHLAGAPVTLSQLKGIYVHSKIMMVDDVFVSIGSANLNRRGLLHDGEINVFAVPQQLKSAADNPARQLRTALWAEHLGLPPAMGESLLADPGAAFELFRRLRYEGNRFTPFEALDVSPYLSMSTSDALVSQLLMAVGFGLTVELIPTIWNNAVDPTSFLDPNATPGPT